MSQHPVNDEVKRLVQDRPDFYANRPAYLDRAVMINDFIHLSYGLYNAYLITTADTCDWPIENAP